MSAAAPGLSWYASLPRGNGPVDGATCRPVRVAIARRSTAWLSARRKTALSVGAILVLRRMKYWLAGSGYCTVMVPPSASCWTCWAPALRIASTSPVCAAMASVVGSVTDSTMMEGVLGDPPQ